MGKKPNNKKPKAKDFLEARGMRKREQHQQRNVENEKHEKKANDEIDIQQWKEQHREKKVLRWADEVVQQKKEPPPRKEKEVPKSVIAKPIVNKEETKVTTVISQGPPVTCLDTYKLNELIKKAKERCLANLALKWGKKETICTEEMFTLERTPRFNGISKAVEQTVNTIKLRNTHTCQELETTEKEQMEELQKVCKDENVAFMDSIKHQIVLDEVKPVSAKFVSNWKNAKKTHATVDGSPRIPTRENFKEISQVLRSFIAVRNKKLTNCSRAEVRKNRAADNYTRTYSLLQRHKNLLQFVQNERLRKKTSGARVLQISVVLLHKMIERLRRQSKVIFTKNKYTSSKSWNKKLKTYWLKTDVHKKNIARMKQSLEMKKVEVKEASVEKDALKTELEKVISESIAAKKIFEENCINTVEYETIKNIQEILEKQLMEVKVNLKTDLQSLSKCFVEELRNCKNEERNIDYLKNDFEKLKKESETKQKRRSLIEKKQLAIKESIRLQNSAILKHEIFQEDIQKEIQQIQNECNQLKQSIDDKNNQNKQLARKCRIMVRQSQCLQRYQHQGKLHQIVYAI